MSLHKRFVLLAGWCILSLTFCTQPLPDMKETVHDYLQESLAKGDSEITINNISRIDSAYFSEDPWLLAQTEQIEKFTIELKMAFSKFKELLEIDKLGENGAKSISLSIDDVDQGLTEVVRLQKESIGSMLKTGEVNLYQISADLATCLQTLNNRRYEGYEECFATLEEAKANIERLQSQYALLFARFKSYFIEDASSYFNYKRYEGKGNVPYSVQFSSTDSPDRRAIVVWDQENQKVVKHNELFD